MCVSLPLTHSPCNGSSEVCESPSRDAFDTHFDNRLHMPDSGISEFQFRFRVRRMSSLTLPINFVLNWVLNAGRRQQQKLALPTDGTPQPTYSPPLPIPTPRSTPSSTPLTMTVVRPLATNAPNVQPCAYFLVTSPHVSLSSALSLSSPLSFPLSSLSPPLCWPQFVSCSQFIMPNS